MLILRARYGDDDTKAYGAFWRIIEAMVRKSDTSLIFFALEGLAPNFRVTYEWLRGVVDMCIEVGLFTITSENTFTSQRLLQHKEVREKGKQANRDAGRKGGLQRHYNATNTLGVLKQNEAEPSIGEESIGQDNKGENSIVDNVGNTQK
jgi:hypothetical protein